MQNIFIKFDIIKINYLYLQCGTKPHRKGIELCTTKQCKDIQKFLK